MTEYVFDGTGYIPGDIALAVLITLSACLSYGRIAFEVIPALWIPVPRLLIAFGFTLWALRFWITLATGDDVMVAPVSMVAIGMITTGYCVVQLRAIRRALALSRDPLYCLQMPGEPCQREDRVEQAMRRKHD